MNLNARRERSVSHITHPPTKVPGIAELSDAQFCDVLAAVAELTPEQYQLGVSKIFLKAGRGKFLEDLK